VAQRLVKYDLDIDPANLNTSHGLVLDLVGTGRRVLDVGCSTGQLGRLLAERGNTVSGVELDPEAAAIAEAHLERVVVTDLESTDLVAELGPGSFDALVFADVLEHLRDPADVLRRAKGLLAPGGFVVISLPNVAHGSVRLALLDGNFEYRDLGLLDSTHLRFFTRSTVDGFLRSTGLAPVAFRRTTAGIFSTEIAVAPLSFSEEVLDKVAGSPEAETYQFVVKAVPVESDASHHELVTALVDKDRELQEVRGQMAGIVGLVGAGPEAPVVGVLSWATGSAGEGPIDVIRRATVAGELRRRLRGASVRSYVMATEAGCDPSEGETVTAVLPWDAAGADRITTEASVVVVSGPLPPPAGDGRPDREQARSDLTGRGCRVLTLGPAPGPEGAAGPDPLVLADRLYSPTLLHRRADYLRVTGALDADRHHIVVSLAAVSRSTVPALCRALGELAPAAETRVLFLDAPDEPGSPLATAEYLALLPGSRALDPATGPIDLLAVIRSADAVISDRADVLSLALALCTPYVAFSPDPPPDLVSFTTVARDSDLVIDRADQLPGALRLAQLRASDPVQRARLTGEAEMALDALVEEATDAVSAGVARTVGTRLAQLTRRLLELETANAGLQRRLIAERMAFGTRAASLLAPTDPAPAAGVQTSSADLAAARAEVERLRTEIDAIHNLKTMRLLKPARETYGRWRSRTR
jgi:SAM-dependent methyltransferase